MRSATSSLRSPSTGGKSTAPSPSQRVLSEAAKPSAMPSVSSFEAVSRKVSPASSKGALTIVAPSVSATSFADHDGCVSTSTTPIIPRTDARSSSDETAPLASETIHPATVM